MDKPDFNIDEFYIDADLGVWGDIDSDSIIERVYASVFKVHLYKGEKLLWIKEIDARKEIRELKKTEEINFETEVGNILTKVGINDLNGDGIKEIIVGRADGILAAMDLKGKTVWSTDLLDYIVSFDVADVNKDNKPEIIAVTGGGKVILLNNKGYKIWLKEYPRAYAPNDVKIIKGETGYYIALAMKDGGLVLLDHKGEEKASYYPLRESIKMLHINDFTGNGKKDIILGGDMGGLAVIDLEGNIIALHRFSSEIVHVSTLDANRDGKLEIIAGDWEGSIKILNIDGVLVSRDPYMEINEDIDNDGVMERILRYWKRVTVFKNGEKYWEEEFRRWVSSIDVYDINDDGKKEIIVGALDKFLRIYSYDGELLWAYKLLRTPLGLFVGDIDKDNSSELISVGEKELRIFKIKK